MNEEEFWMLVDEIIDREGGVSIADLMMLREAQASVNLDKGDGETHAL